MTSNSIPQFIEIPANAMSLAMRRKVHGVGTNDARYATEVRNGSRSNRCPYYVKWASMLQRCYSEKYATKNPTYINCIVCDEWLTFSNFKKWMKKQDWAGKQLDKDLLVLSNKIYSPETCIFVSQHINDLLLDCGSRSGKYPQGVSYYKRDGSYEVKCRVEHSSRFLGRYPTICEAKLVYKKAKAKEIRRIAELQADSRLKKALHTHADTFRRLVKRRT